MGMDRSYSQTRAMFAIATASLRSMLRSPSAIIFSVLFPFIFILVFGFLSSPVPVIRVAYERASDTSHPIARALRDRSNVIVSDKDSATIRTDREKGRITALLRIDPVNPAGYPKYRVVVTSSSASGDRIGLLQSVILRTIGEVERSADPNRPVYAFMESVEVPGRVYRTIDFVLPGQLGFSLLSAGVEFDGIVACSDVFAMSAMRALAERGRKVPADVVQLLGYVTDKLRDIKAR